jgi:tetratricopeptide (TPR) repeat protein
MATTEKNRDRHAVPRLRSFASAASLGELASIESAPESPVSSEVALDLLEDWEREPGVSVAADLVASALAVGNKEAAREAAKFLLSCQDVPPLARGMAGVYLGEINPEEISPGVRAIHAEQFSALDMFGDQIRRTRQQLNLYPADAILWTNLATLYVSQGQRRQAERAIRIALALAPQNRFVLRSAARMLLHLGKCEEAHSVLLRSDSLKGDPWVLSAEISVAATNDRISEHIKLAERVLDKSRFSPSDMSELAAELATVRALDGDVWAAKKHLRRAMEQPCENTWAQAAWLARIPGMPAVSVKSTISHEANALLNRQSGKLRLCMLQTQEWLNDQPFSRRPAQMGSFLATRIDRDEVGIRFAEQGLRVNPKDPILLNNLAFSAARFGDIQKAKASLRRISLSDMEVSDRSVLTATEGLIAYRENDLMRGRDLYRRAIEDFRQKKDVREVVAQAYQALEEYRAHTADAPRLVEMALKVASEKLFQPEDRPLIEQLAHPSKALQGPGLLVDSKMS